MTKHIFRTGERCYLGYSAAYRAPEKTSVARAYKTKEGKRRLSVASKQGNHIFEYDPDHGWFSLEHSGRTLLTEREGHCRLQQRQNKAVLERLRERCQLLLAANDAEGIQQLTARLKLLLDLPRIMPGVMKPALCARCAREKENKR